MKTITLNALKTKVFLFTLSLICMSCTNDDGGTPQLCADYNFYGLRINDFNNSDGDLSFVMNTSDDVTNPGIQVLSNLSTTQNFSFNHPAFDRTSEILAFIDEFNGGTKMFVATLSNLTEIALSPAASYGAPIFIGNQLYALEFDQAGIYVCKLTAAGVATRISGIIGANNYHSDTGGNKGYGVLSVSGSLLFLVDHMLYEVTSTGIVLNTITVNSPNGTEYYDIETDPDTGGLFLPKWDNGSRSIVHWDFSGGAIVESTIIANIEFNRESVSLAFNNCGNRLLVLSNGTYINNVQENSRIWELEIPNSPNAGTILDSSSFTDVFLGLVY